MWDIILGRLPTKMILLNAFFSVFIPWSLYKFHQKLAKYADPPWKKNDNR